VHIHVVGINYWPEATGIAVFSTGRAERLAASGHTVTVCTAVPYYPLWHVAEAYRRRPFAREMREGVEIVRCPLYVPSHVTTGRRIVHEASFVAMALLRSLVCRRPDLLVVVSPPLALGIVAVLLAKRWRVPYVFHVADLQPDAAVDLGMIARGRLTRLLYAVERFAYRRAALVSTLTEAMRARVIAKGIAAEKVVLFSDWADPELFDLPAHAADQELRTELNLPRDAFLVLHAGNMGVKQGLDVVIDAATRTAPEAGVVYMLVGDGAERMRLETRVRESGTRRVRMIRLQPRDRFHRLLAAADVALVTQQRAVADIVFPSKVLTLLAAGKPVVASVAAGSDVADVVRRSACGVVVPPEDPGALAAAIERFRLDPDLRGRCAAAGRAYARAHWERSRTLEHLVRTLESAAGRRSDTPPPLRPRATTAPTAER
jgi:colanic acid biosynthesis glycosyl transferase WcaI